jgi:hypothetical protein
MRRRNFLSVLGGAAAWPLAAHAQQPTEIRRIGVLLNLSENDVEAQRLVKAFRERLAQLGWPDNRNLPIAKMSFSMASLGGAKLANPLTTKASHSSLGSAIQINELA